MVKKNKHRKMKSKENKLGRGKVIQKSEKLSKTSNPNREKIPTSEKEKSRGGKITTPSNTRKEIQMYKIHCVKCKKTTAHYVTKVSRKRGVKLTCSCNNQKNNYINLQRLKK